jgi:hypothetical protein
VAAVVVVLAAAVAAKDSRSQVARSASSLKQ